MKINTKRLIIRPLSEEDRESMTGLLTNAVIKKTYMLPDFGSEEEAVQLFERLRALSLSEEHYVGGICLSDQLIGFLNDVEQTKDSIELGYVISPEFHNCGFATEALGGVISDLFARGFFEVTAGAFEENRASIRVMEKCGMNRVEREEEIAYRGEVHHCVYYSIKKDKYEEKSNRSGGAL
ncbi:MAG: GNAT family N-acetyltransferase [Lachnospiraceae bacterium]|nr:GNAT family N-acetyltransferase [Lachnospiraceae bacterium]